MKSQTTNIQSLYSHCESRVCERCGNPGKIASSLTPCNDIWMFGNWNLGFICYLEFVIWNLSDSSHSSGNSHYSGRSRGFTLYELLLSVAVIAIIAGVGVPVFVSYQGRSGLDIATNAAVQSIRRAQILSTAVSSDSPWGVRFDDSSIILFRGQSFAGRDPDYDEVFETTTVITVSGTSEIVFSKLTGEPQDVGAIVLTSNSGEQREITVNEKGMVEY